MDIKSVLYAHRTQDHIMMEPYAKVIHAPLVTKFESMEPVDWFNIHHISLQLLPFPLTVLWPTGSDAHPIRSTQQIETVAWAAQVTPEQWVTKLTATTTNVIPIPSNQMMVDVIDAHLDTNLLTMEIHVLQHTDHQPVIQDNVFQMMELIALIAHPSQELKVQILYVQLMDAMQTNMYLQMELAEPVKLVITDLTQIAITVIPTWLQLAHQHKEDRQMAEHVWIAQLSPDHKMILVTVLQTTAELTRLQIEMVLVEPVHKVKNQTV